MNFCADSQLPQRVERRKEVEGVGGAEPVEGVAPEPPGDHAEGLYVCERESKEHLCCCNRAFVFARKISHNYVIKLQKNVKFWYCFCLKF